MKTLLITNSEFHNIIDDLITNDTVLKMRNYKQHFNVSCFEHCYYVAYCSYSICKKLGLDYRSITRAAMLHDLFLYDWRDKNSHRRFHAFHHGKTACLNACKHFELTQKEKDMIIRHMWPVTFYIPNSIEGFILTFVDKYCTLIESWNTFKLHTYSLKYFKYIYYLFYIIAFNLKQI